MLKIGLPAGSLADPKRGGNLVDLLKTAGFPTRGYDAGGPSLFSTVTALYGWDGRPQEFGTQLGLNELDAAIAGDDWIRERVIELHMEYGINVNPEKIMSLKRGDVSLVGIVNSDVETDDPAEFIKTVLERNSILTAASEMPYLTLDWLQKLVKKKGLLDRFNNYSVQKYKSPPKIRSGIVIYETWGKTESKVKNGGVDIGLEITQTGSAIRNYGLKIIDEVMTSETGVWMNPEVRNSKEKSDLLRMFLLNLHGALNAENKVLIVFNVPNGSTGSVEEYIAGRKLFADEPTRNRGTEFTEYSLQIDTVDTALPLAKVRYDLMVLGAKNLDTIPIMSSISSISDIGF